MEEVKYILAVGGGVNGLAQSGLGSKTEIHNETVGTAIDSLESIVLKLCTLTSMLAKCERRLKSFRENANYAKFFFGEHVSACLRNS